MELPVIDVRADAAPQEAHEKRHLLRWWNDTSGKDPAEFRAAGPLPCFGERLTDAAGAWMLTCVCQSRTSCVPVVMAVLPRVKLTHSSVCTYVCYDTFWGMCSSEASDAAGLGQHT